MAASSKAKGIPTAVYYPRCLHEQPVFAGLGYARDAFPHAIAATESVLSLPMHPWLTDAQVRSVAEALAAATE